MLAYYGTYVKKGSKWLYPEKERNRDWLEVAREAQVYQILRKAEGSFASVFLSGRLTWQKFIFCTGLDKFIICSSWAGENKAQHNGVESVALAEDFAG